MKKCCNDCGKKPNCCNKCDSCNKCKTDPHCGEMRCPTEPCKGCIDVIPAECVQYNGENLISCNPTISIKKGDKLDVIIKKFFNAISSNTIAFDFDPDMLEDVSVSALKDVEITNPVTNSILFYDGTKWTNMSIAELAALINISNRK